MRTLDDEFERDDEDEFGDLSEFAKKFESQVADPEFVATANFSQQVLDDDAE